MSVFISLFLRLSPLVVSVDCGSVRGEEPGGARRPPPDSNPFSDAEFCENLTARQAQSGCNAESPIPVLGTPSAFHPHTFLRGHYEIKLTANSCIALCSSTKAVNISSARMMKRFPWRCASTNKLLLVL
jgi:hypothetical protein